MKDQLLDMSLYVTGKGKNEKMTRGEDRIILILTSRSLNMVEFFEEKICVLKSKTCSKFKLQNLKPSILLNSKCLLLPGN